MTFAGITAHLKGFITLYGLKFGTALLILLAGTWLAKVVARATGTAMAKSKVDPTLASFAKNVLYAGLLIFVVIAALDKLGVQTTSFIAFLGAAGLAIGLALQGSLSNLSSGVMLIVFRPFKVGDSVKVSGVEGVVSDIQIFTTVLSTPDNKRVIIPNSKITGDIIVNNSPAPPAGRA